MLGRDRTVTVKVRASERFGEPSSVTRTVMALVVFASPSLVGKVKRPLAESIAAPLGAPGSRLNASKLVGMSASVALFEITRVVPAWIVKSGMSDKTGALLVSKTIT